MYFLTQGLTILIHFCTMCNILLGNSRIARYSRRFIVSHKCLNSILYLLPSSPFCPPLGRPRNHHRLFLDQTHRLKENEESNCYLCLTSGSQQRCDQPPGVNFTNKCTRSFDTCIFPAAQLLFHQHLWPTLPPTFPLDLTRIFFTLLSTPNFCILPCPPIKVGINPLV